jgi:predicted aconitase/predicted aconitase with swiveling domain
MTSTAQQTLYGTSHVPGKASGTLLASDIELSFWGGVDHVTGEVVDRYHPLSGQLLKDKILAMPGGRGSCSGSATILELILNGNGPSALIFERTNEILAVGVFVAEELFEKTVPMVILDHDDFETVLKWNEQTVYIEDHRISTSLLGLTVHGTDPRSSVDPHLQRVELSESDTSMLRGDPNYGHGYSEAQKLAMKIIIRTAAIMNAPYLMSITQAHVDGAHFGPASVLFGKQLRNLGGRFAVPTTVNALTIDQQRWRDLGVDVTFGTESDELARAFLDMGATMSFTCAPYQLDSAPKLGDDVAFGESNVVCYSNSVLGARTAKYPNMLEALIALTGRAPKAGCHLSENRIPRIWITAPDLKGTHLDDAFWPMLGYTIGTKAASRIPIITGLETLKPSRDDLKAFSAAFATSAGAPMFHMAGITPEAPTLEAACGAGSPPPRLDIRWQDLASCWTEFNQNSTPRTVDLISLGNPHFSIQEIKRLSFLCRGMTKYPSTSIIVTTSRAQHSLATQAGYIAELEAFGVQILTDTCWCFIRDPVIKKEVKCIMTNSAKYVHYGPGLTGRQFCFGSLDMCVKAACTGRWAGEAPAWLQAYVGNSVEK